MNRTGYYNSFLTINAIVLISIDIITNIQYRTGTHMFALIFLDILFHGSLHDHFVKLANDLMGSLHKDIV
jgi:hypothetical protein